jgi:2-polyprenyl-3-methyl-5-hydroxy-6-metoxy-1,4-benzoquinol methylase
MEQNYNTHGTSFSDYKYDVKEYFTKRYANKKISILDVGAGTGIYSYLLRDLTHKIDAVEVYTPNIEGNNLNYLYDTVHNMNIIDYEFDYYDLIIMGDVLEHLSVKDAKKVIKRMYDKCEEMLIAVPFKLEQDELYGNAYEKHLQPDLTDELFHKRYPGFKVLFMNEKYAYYIKEDSLGDSRYTYIKSKEGIPESGYGLTSKAREGSKKDIDRLKLWEIHKPNPWIDGENHPFHKYRYNYILEYLNRLYGDKKQSVKVLDIGSYTGTFANMLYKSGFKDITCFDISIEAVKLGQKTFPHLNWMQGDIELYDLADKYDLIIMGEVLEHLIDPKNVISKITGNNLTEDGILFYSVPSEELVFSVNSENSGHISKLEKDYLEEISTEFNIVTNDSGDETQFSWYIGYIKEKDGEKKMERRKLSIAFLDTIGTPYNGDTLKTRGMGGSESAIVYLSEELTKLDFEVTVFNKCDKEGNYGGIEYIDIRNAHKNTKEFDVLITSRTVLPYAPIHHREAILNRYGYDIQPLKAIVDRSSYKVMWLHDTFILGEEWVEDVLVDRDYDEIFTLSDFHTNYIAKATHGNRPRFFEVLKDRMFETRNGIRSFYDEVDIEAKDKDLFVYNASTTKGLVPLMRQIWPRVKQDIPNAKLIIIGGYYAGVAPKGQMDEIETVFRELQKDFDGKLGVTFTGIITQKEVADILVKASYFIYPGAFPETFGISATEALNYNVPLITTKFGALEEIAPEKTSYHINFSITRDMNLYDRVYSKGEPEQVEKFIALVKSVYNNEYIRKQKMYAANEYKPFLGWDTVALQWKHHLLHKLKLYMNREEMERVRYVTGRLNTLYNRRFINEEDKIEDYSLDYKNKIVVVSPMYNISRYMATHILSVAAQLYDNYVHYIIDDMSNDNSMDIFKEVVGNLPEKIRDKYVIIKNSEKKYALRNQVELISSLEGNPIIVLLDGDDFLDNDPDIFNYINRQYLNGAKFTYGSCHSLADDIDLVAQPYPKKVLEDRSYRNYLFPWGMPYTHLRTFRKSVFDAADHSKFKDENGNYWRAGGDNALFYPLMDVCEPHEIRAIQKILVRYNDINPLNDYKVNAEEQNKAAAIIRDDNNRITAAEEGFDFHLENARETKDARSVAYIKAVYKNNEKMSLSSLTSFNSESSYIEIKLLEYIRDHFEGRDENNLSIIDTTAGVGNFIADVKNMNIGFNSVTAVDAISSVVEMGKMVHSDFSWYNGNIEDDYLNGSYDLIVLKDNLTKLADPEAVINRLIKDNLNPGGLIVYSVLSEEHAFIDPLDFNITIINEDIEKISDKFEIVEVDTKKWYTGAIMSKKIKTKKKESVMSVKDDNRERSILIAIPTAKNIETDTFKSIYRLKKPDGYRVDFECFYGYNIDQVRNLMAHYTINNRYDYIYFVDSDMILPEDSLIKLLSHNKGIVSGLYIQRRLEAKIPEMYRRRPNGGVTNLSMDELEDNTLMEIESCGFGGVLIKREVLEKVGYPYFFYKHSIDFKDTVSEDVYFCLKAESKGYKTYLDTSLKYNHISRIDLVPVK